MSHIDVVYKNICSGLLRRLPKHTYHLSAYKSCSSTSSRCKARTPFLLPAADCCARIQTLHRAHRCEITRFGILAAQRLTHRADIGTGQGIIRLYPFHPENILRQMRNLDSKDFLFVNSHIAIHYYCPTIHYRHRCQMGKSDVIHAFQRTNVVTIIRCMMFDV